MLHFLFLSLKRPQISFPISSDGRLYQRQCGYQRRLRMGPTDHRRPETPLSHTPSRRSQLRPHPTCGLLARFYPSQSASLFPPPPQFSLLLASVAMGPILPSNPSRNHVTPLPSRFSSSSLLATLSSSTSPHSPSGTPCPRSRFSYFFHNT